MRPKRSGPSADYEKNLATRNYSDADLEAREQQIRAAREQRMQERMNQTARTDVLLQPVQNTANNSSVAQPAEIQISEILGIQQTALPVPHAPIPERAHPNSGNSPCDHTAQEWLSKPIEVTRSVAQCDEDENQTNQSLHHASLTTPPPPAPAQRRWQRAVVSKSRNTQKSYVQANANMSTDAATSVKMATDAADSTGGVSQPTSADAEWQDGIAHASTCNNFADAIPADFVPMVPAQTHCVQSRTNEPAIAPVTHNVCPKSFSHLRRDILDPLYNACIWDEEIQEWIIPSLHTELTINKQYWRNILREDFPTQTHITKCVATFYLDEPDHNREFKPRLDIVLSFSDGTKARYHPGAKLIWSHEDQPTEAMRQRYNVAAKRANKDTENSH